MNRFTFTAFIISCAVLSAQAQVKPSTDDVVMIFELARHGSRAPVIKIGPKSDWVTKAGLGELTNVGMRQRYNLGKNTAARYANLLGTQFGAEDFIVISTNFNRTIMSAVSHVMGL